MAAATRMVRLVIAAIALLSMPGMAWAEIDLFGLKAEGEVDLSGRVYIERPPPNERAKLEEYRDLDQLPFGGFRFRLFRPDEKFGLDLKGINVGQTDQEFSLSTGQPGSWNFGFDWNQIPHLLSTNARLLAIQPPSGVLPPTRPPLATYNASPTLELQTQWDVATFSFTMTPTPDSDIQLQYTRIKKDGQRPSSMAFGSPGNNFAGVRQPIDQTINDFRIKGSWVGEGWQLQGGYTLSLFQNDDTSVVVGNPCFRLAACGTDATGAPALGRVSLAPNNMANTLWLSGAIDLPMRTRIIGNASYSLRTQNADFFPHTINSNISSPLLTLPQSSLDGKVGTFLFNVNATSRPLPPLTLTAKYRLFDYNDMTPELTFPAFVLNDRTLDIGPRTSGAYSYLKQDAGLDARWRFGRPLALTIGGGWERWDRNEHREASTTNEYFVRAKADWTPLDWMQVRLDYVPSFRRVSNYNTSAHLEHTVVEEDLATAVAQGQSPRLRKFDEADRNRQRVGLMVQLSPTEVVSITPTFGYRYDDYYNSPLGLQTDQGWSVGIDVGWTPVERLTLSAGYVYEWGELQMRSTSRDVSGATVIQFPDYDWVSKTMNTINTAYAGARATLIPKVLDWVLDFRYENATGQVDTFNPVKPFSGPVASRTNATARSFPEITDNLIHVETSLRYRFSQAWTAAVTYVFERFRETDGRTDGLTPFIPGVTSIFLGSSIQDYTAQWVVLSLAYQF